MMPPKFILEDRQCTYNVTLLRVRVTLLVVEAQQCVLAVFLSYVSLSVTLSIVSDK
jgi:hypothetical protein